MPSKRLSARSLLVSTAVLLGVMLCFVPGSTTRAAPPPLDIGQADDSQFPVIHVPISIADALGVPLDDLPSDAVALREDGRPVDGIQVAPVVDQDESVAEVMILDTRATTATGGKLETTRRLAAGLLETIGPNDVAAVVSFGTNVVVTHNFSGDRSVLKGAIDQLTAGGNASVFDGLSRGVDLVSQSPQHHKLVVLVSDAEGTQIQSDAARIVAARSVQAKARGANALVFAIAAGDNADWQLLDNIVTATDQAMAVSDSATISDTFGRVTERLKRKFTVTYTSTLPADDQQHQLDLRVGVAGQNLDGTTTYTARRVPLEISIDGLPVSGRVTGHRKIDVVVHTGTMREAQLLIDDQQRSVVRDAPFSFDWDTSQETPGTHQLVVRATGPGDVTAEQHMTVEVIAPQSEPPTLVVVGAIAVLAAAGVLGLRRVIQRSRRRVSTPVARASRPARISPLEARPDAPVKRTAAAPGENTMVAPRARLLIVDQGVEREESIRWADFTIGRDPENQIVITDAQASRKHAKMVLQGDTFWIQDLGSTNGTWVNGDPTTSRQMADGDRIKVGDALLTFRVRRA